MAPLQGAAAGCRCKMPLQGACVRVLFALWSLVAVAAAGCRCRVPLQGAAAGCCYCWSRCRVLLQRHAGAWSLELRRWCCCKVPVHRCCCRCRVSLQGACIGAVFALWSLATDAAGGAAVPLRTPKTWPSLSLTNHPPTSFRTFAARCCCQSAAARYYSYYSQTKFALWSLVAVAASECHCRVPLQCAAVRLLLRLGAWLLMLLEGAAAGCAAAACASEWLLVPLRGVSAGCWCRSAVAV